MKIWIGFMLFVILSLCYFPVFSEEKKKALTDNYYIESKIVYKNVTVFPVYAKKVKDRADYLLLDEGLKQGLVKVREVGGKEYSSSARVNEVEVNNLSQQQKLFLLSGEIILGGKQDRIIARDTIVPKKSGWTKVKVFCVEHGRWRGRTGKFASGDAISHTGVRGKAQFKGQSEVWDEVNKTNESLDTETSTDTYREVIRSDKLKEKVNEYFEKINAKFPASENVVGLVYCANGKLVVMEIFKNPTLFRKLKDKLLKSYIIATLKKSTRVIKNVSAQQVVNFYKKHKELQAKRKKVAEKNKMKREESYKDDDSGYYGTETYDEDEDSEEGEAEAVHEMSGVDEE